MRTNEQCRALKRQAQTFPKFPNSLVQFLRAAHRCPQNRKKIFQGYRGPLKSCLIHFQSVMRSPLTASALPPCRPLTDLCEDNLRTPVFGLLQAEPGGLYLPWEMIEHFPASVSCFQFLESYMDPLKFISENTFDKMALSCEASTSWDPFY